MLFRSLDLIQYFALSCVAVTPLIRNLQLFWDSNTEFLENKVKYGFIIGGFMGIDLVFVYYDKALLVLTWSF